MRRKLLSLLLVAVMAIVLTACDNKDKKAVNEALDLLTVPSGVVEDFELPAKSGEIAFKWKSSNEDAIKIGETNEETGKVPATVVRSDKDVTVELTVTATLKKVKIEKKFNVVVINSNQELIDITEDSMDEVVHSIFLQVPDRTHADVNLNVRVPWGVTVTWTTSNEQVLNTTGKVTRPSGTGTGVKLVATVVADTEEGETIQKTLEHFVFVYGTDIDVNGVYNAAFGEVQTLNPLNSTQTTESDVYGYLVDYLYYTDYNWEKGIEEGNAQFPGDFSKILGRNENAEANPDKVFMAALGSTKRLGMAAKFPFAVNLGNDFELRPGVVDEKKAKESQDDEWIITLREGLKFADGRVIDTHVYEYSFKQYLDGKQNNERANYLYNEDYIPLVNAEGYFKQGRPKDSQNPDGEKWPEVKWEEVGFEIIDDLTFKLKLVNPVSQWHLMTYLGIVNLVHPEKFEEGFDSTRTKTSYGSVTNIPVSYGPYVLSNWEDDVKFTFKRNENYYRKHHYTIKTINGPIIVAQTDIINEFKEGNLDAAGVGGQYWKEFMNHPNLYVSPSNSFYRFAISIDRSEGTSGKQASPILKQKAFRRALYLATDREDYTNEIQPPSQPALGYLSNIHQVTEWATGPYASSAQHLRVLRDLGLSPETKGYNVQEARRLFLEAYTAAVEAGEYEPGQKVTMEFTYYDAESNRRMANWVKAQYEEVFNETVQYNGQFVEFEVVLDPLNQAQFVAARDSGDFEMCFTGMSGATFQATFGMGYIFSRTFSTFLAGRGHDTGNLEVQAEIIYLYDMLVDKQAAGEELADHEVSFLEKVEDGVFTGTFDDLFRLFSATTNLQVEYEGQQDDLQNITAALEKALLDQMIAIPLFSATSAGVLSDRVIRMAPSFSLFMSWGGLTYTHIKAAK